MHTNKCNPSPAHPSPKLWGGRVAFFQPRKGKLQAFIGAGGTHAGGKSCRDPRALGARPASPAVRGAGRMLQLPAEPRGPPGAAGALIPKYPGHPLSHSGWPGAGLEARICPAGARTHTHARTRARNLTRTLTRTLTPGEATRAQGNRLPSGDEPLRLFPSPLGFSPTTSEGSRARRSAGAGRSRAVPRRERRRRFEPRWALSTTRTA